MPSLQDIHVGQSSCVLCRQSPTLGSYVLVWFHATCYKVLEKSYEPSKKPTFKELERFADATRPVYKSQYEASRETAPVMEGLSSKYTKDIVQDSLRQDLFGELLVEIRIMIAELIAPCWYLICTQLSLTREIWMIRINYRGNSYVTRLSSTPLESAGNYDHIKLSSQYQQNCRFVDHNSNPTPNGSPWYEVLEVRDPHLETRVSCDGQFVRGIQLVSGDSSSACRVWSSPCQPEFHPRNIYNFRGDKNKKLRLDYVKFNTHVRGFLVYCADTKTVGIHGFSDTSAAFRKFVDLVHGRIAWIQKFKICHGRTSSPSLVLQTSLGRIITFGPQFLARIIDQYEYLSLASNEPLPMDTHFAPPAVPPGGGSIALTWYMIKGPLKGLSHHPCLGLLLFNSDQHIEALGQVRWDYGLTQEILMPICVENGTVDGKDYIKDIRSDIHESKLHVETGG
ncbi:hypothetical protein BDV29DRAFT_188150 [Aspergillus leporis]|uniref:Uncharacterized protein n=1 Tax=Aspergillus leporis TaxID=41062 RepID=A0A5N5XGA2_9EURO|nr:hypothetical protein BDV29DRAFT_188150 [Aspergillus leporis]